MEVTGQGGRGFGKEADVVLNSSGNGLVLGRIQARVSPV